MLSPAGSQKASRWLADNLYLLQVGSGAFIENVPSGAAVVSRYKPVLVQMLSADTSAPPATDPSEYSTLPTICESDCGAVSFSISEGKQKRKSAVTRTFASVIKSSFPIIR